MPGSLMGSVDALCPSSLGIWLVGGLRHPQMLGSIRRGRPSGPGLFPACRLAITLLTSSTRIGLFRAVNSVGSTWGTLASLI